MGVLTGWNLCRKKMGSYPVFWLEGRITPLCRCEHIGAWVMILIRHELSWYWALCMSQAVEAGRTITGLHGTGNKFRI
ncbi:hypothetical protein R1flu_001630 [Riccia fluitans]|uniref:Uncharacterized protein n=1 Tax=Riccia fluitans TaxID=41844 RepID=A0ABD1Y492_9MARC